MDTRKPATSEIPLPGPEVFHNYLNELYVARDRTLGMFQLSPGRHILSFIVNGKDPHSVGYNLGINDVVLEKVEKAADTPDVREQMTGTAVGMVYRGFPLSSYVARLHGAPPEDQANPDPCHRQFRFRCCFRIAGTNRRSFGSLGKDSRSSCGSVGASRRA